MVWRPLAAVLIAFGTCIAWQPALATSPSIIFILLDTTRADRLGVGGNPRPASPTLDRLAASGVVFGRHFADAHATRPSMPQLMTGRYYHQNILAPFQADAHPREMSFANPDPTAALLPAILRASGYATVGLSAHTWVAPDSPFGRDFDQFELLATKQAHADAGPLVDRAIALWTGRDRHRPVFLYLHFMDMHMPRPLPGGILAFPVEGEDAGRFRPDGEPAFDRARRRWSRHDARDFTAHDIAYYTAVYDTRLRYADSQIARLLAAVRAEDPELRNTVVVVTADHGEELGEDGRIEHGDSLADGVQHVPWIVAGGPVAANQRCEAATQHVDVVPSILGLLDVPLPAGVHVDGTAHLEPTGRIVQPCGEEAAYYAWETYRGVRVHHHVLEQRLPKSLLARCDGEERLYHIDGLHRRLLTPPWADRKRRYLRALLTSHLAAREASYLAHRYGTPTHPFVMRNEFWEVSDPSSPRCIQVDENTPFAAFSVPGWIWTGRGVTTFDDRPHDPLRVRMAVPPGTYDVAAAGTPIGRRPWFFGFAPWRRKSFLPEEPSEFIPIGRVQASNGTVQVAVPEHVAAGHHVLALRFTPPGTTSSQTTPVDAEQRERLRALGYVQ